MRAGARRGALLGFVLSSHTVKLIVGLGNPGREYALTRHNVGWWAVDHLADAWHFDGWKRDTEAVVASGSVATVRTRLLKPQTYMNLSGAAVRPYARRPQWSPETDLLVIVDDVALPLGTFRLRASGSSGGHNGLKSIEGVLGTRQYARLRIGITPATPRRDGEPLADFVLAPMGKGDRADIAALWPAITAASETWLREGITEAMNQFNRRSTACRSSA
jgi:PTH1 family peptidyl-tRNA hydrolase